MSMTVTAGELIQVLPAASFVAFVFQEVILAYRSTPFWYPRRSTPAVRIADSLHGVFIVSVAIALALGR